MSNLRLENLRTAFAAFDELPLPSRLYTDAIDAGETLDDARTARLIDIGRTLGRSFAPQTFDEMVEAASPAPSQELVGAATFVVEVASYRKPSFWKQWSSEEAKPASEDEVKNALSTIRDAADSARSAFDPALEYLRTPQEIRPPAHVVAADEQPDPIRLAAHEGWKRVSAALHRINEGETESAKLTPRELATVLDAATAAIAEHIDVRRSSFTAEVANSLNVIHWRERHLLDVGRRRIKDGSDYDSSLKRIVEIVKPLTGPGAVVSFAPDGERDQKSPREPGVWERATAKASERLRKFVSAKPHDDDFHRRLSNGEVAALEAGVRRAALPVLRLAQAGQDDIWVKEVGLDTAVDIAVVHIISGSVNHPSDIATARQVLAVLTRGRNGESFAIAGDRTLDRTARAAHALATASEEAGGRVDADFDRTLADLLDPLLEELNGVGAAVGAPHMVSMLPELLRGRNRPLRTALIEHARPQAVEEHRERGFELDL